MKGYLLLSEGRSGSTWLGSLANSTGQMGNVKEALRREFLGTDPGRFSPEEFFDLVVAGTSTPNGRFGVKIFPKHLIWAQSHFGFDFIAGCQAEHDVKLIVLRRKNRLEQAISLYRARITSQWRSDRTLLRPPRYDFEKICRSYYQIVEGESFWQAYFELRQLKTDVYFYEDLISDPSPYLNALAAYLEVHSSIEFSSGLRVQRDETSEDWKRRFMEEALSRNVLIAAESLRRAPRTVENVVRFLKKQPLSLQ